MKTLIKRPNYTLSIKTSCYSAFSFYPFFRNDRIPALLSALPSARTNQPSELHDRSFFILLHRPHSLPPYIYRRESTALLIDEGRTKASSTKPLTKSEFTKA